MKFFPEMPVARSGDYNPEYWLEFRVSHQPRFAVETAI
jgi:hypothetical protein